MKHLSDSERLTQLTLNRKYMELEEKDRVIERLQRENGCLKLQIAEQKETISNLCNQISRLFLNHRTNA